MNVSFIVPTRNKAKWVERAALSYIRQTYTPMEIVFFDQGSTDGTLEILKGVQAHYEGPNVMRVLSCPDTKAGGTAAGMNADIAWVHTQIAAKQPRDVILWGNADDFAYPRRTARTVEAFQSFGVSWVSCCQYFMTAELVIQGETSIPEKRDRPIEFAEALQYQVGSSGALAYTRDLWDKYGPMRSIEQNDIVLPLMAFLERGMYFIAEPLHTYVFHASESNQGIGGRLLAAKSPEQRTQLEETNAFNLVSNWMSVATRLTEASTAGRTIAPEVMVQLNQRLWGCVQAWEKARLELTLGGIRPVGLHA